MPMLCAQNGQKNVIGYKLKKIRERRGLSQRDLVKEFQKKGYRINQITISRIERKSRHVRVSEILAIMDVLEITSAELFEENKIDHEE